VNSELLSELIEITQGNDCFLRVIV